MTSAGDGGGTAIPALSGTARDPVASILQAPKVGVDAGQGAETPFPLHDTPTDEEARAAGYRSAEDWFSRSAAASLAGPAVKAVEFKALPQPEEMEALPPGGEDAEEEEFPGLPAGTLEVLGRAAERELSSLFGIERPYLLIDVEPRSRVRAEECRNMREILAGVAKEEWAKDTGSNEQEARTLPPLMDGRNCRPVLRSAQLDAFQTYGVIVQLRSELTGKDMRQGPTKAVPPLKPTERELYRLNPLDDVLERKVSLAACCIWVPVVPDSAVEGEEPPTSWRRWMYEFAHASTLNPHRSSGESYQILRRMGYWSTLGPDFNRWYSECLPCQKYRARAVQPPMRSILADDRMRQKSSYVFRQSQKSCLSRDFARDFSRVFF